MILESKDHLENKRIEVQVNIFLEADRRPSIMKVYTRKKRGDNRDLGKERVEIKRLVIESRDGELIVF